jgi:hypothetical protein
MSTTTVIYSDDSLTIRIPTATPAALHNLLLKGLVSGLKSRLLIEDFAGHETDGLLALATVLATIVPSELHLERAYS